MLQPSLLQRHDRVRHLFYLGLMLVLLVVVGGDSLGTAVFIMGFFAVMAGVDAAVDYVGLPERTTGFGYALVLAASGVGIAVLESPFVGGAVTLVAGWIALDTFTAIRYAEPRERHEFVAGTNGDRGEVMLRMQTLPVVYRALEDSDRPRTPDSLAAELDLTETRVASALSYLDHKERADRVEEGYRAIPSRWGRLQPFVSLARWIPRRIVKPFARLART